MNSEAVATLAGTVSRVRAESLGLLIACTRTIRETRELRSRNRSLVSERRQLSRHYIDNSLRRVIRLKILGGQLPSHRPASVLGAPGTGGLCAVCNRPLLPAHLVMDVPAPDTLVHLHADCFSLWDDERRSAARAS